MNRVRRSLIILAVSLVVTLVAMVVRWLNAGGMFTDVKPDFAGTCTAIATPTGPGDIRIDPQDKLIFVAVSDARALERKTPSQADGLYTAALDNAGAGLKKLSGTPRDFHPRGISLYRAPDGALTLMAVNVPASADPAIEIFDVSVKNGAAALKERASITSGRLVRPVDVAAVGPDRFYVTNAGTSVSSIGRFFERYALLPLGNVVYFDGTVFRVVAGNLSDAQGVVASDDGAHVYVTTRSGRTLYAFSRGLLSGELNPEGELSIDAGLGRLSPDARGGLLVAGSPKPFFDDKFRTNPAKPSPSQIFAVRLDKGIPGEADAIYTNKGYEIGAASVAVAAANGHMFVGSALDRKILDCTENGPPNDVPQPLPAAAENKKGAAPATPF